MTWKDGSGRTLADYPRPSVAVDTALLTVVPGVPRDYLAVLLHRRTDGGELSRAPGQWAMPGTFLHEGERLADAVARSLVDKCGIRDVVPRQIHVFDDPARDERGWVLSVAHSAVVSYRHLVMRVEARPDLHLATITEGEQASVVLPEGQAHLPFEQGAIVSFAVAELRQRYSDALDPDRLLPEPFTLSALRRLHEAVEGREWQKDTFRRRAEPQVVETEQLSSGDVGRPARLFRHA
jgi:ADP-ribose pyrophosphatase YjhB (NUDIX family)